MSEAQDPGRLSRRMTIETAQDTDDGAGGAARSFVESGAFWAELKPASARFQVQFGSGAQRVSHELYYRRGPALTTEKRLRFGARVFRILSVRDANDSGTRQLALIEEIKP